VPPLRAYFHDEPLLPEELAFLREAFLGPAARWPTGADAIEERKVPGALPEDPGAPAAMEALAETIRQHLRSAGIADDHGRQVIWVMPKAVRWSVVFQDAIAAETGLHPFVVQRWRFDLGAGEATRRAPKILDLEAMMRQAGRK
jgi:hypothetical protein